MHPRAGVPRHALHAPDARFPGQPTLRAHTPADFEVPDALAPPPFRFRRLAHLIRRLLCALNLPAGQARYSTLLVRWQLRLQLESSAGGISPVGLSPPADPNETQ